MNTPNASAQDAREEEYSKAWNEDGDGEQTAFLGIGSGAAKQAADSLSSRAYRIHLEESKAMGEKPMSPEEFAKQQKPQKV
jgi:hypothetical protein